MSDRKDTTTKGVAKPSEEQLKKRVYVSEREVTVMVAEKDGDGKVKTHGRKNDAGKFVNAKGKVVTAEEDAAQDPTLVANQVPKINADGKFVDANDAVVADAKDAATIDEKFTVESVEIYMTGNANNPLRYVHHLARGKINGEAIKSEMSVDVSDPFLDQDHVKAVLNNIDGKAGDQITAKDIVKLQSVAESHVNNVNLNAVQRSMYVDVLRTLPDLAAEVKTQLSDKAALANATQDDKDAFKAFDDGYADLKTSLDESSAYASDVNDLLVAQENVKPSSLRPRSGIAFSAHAREAQAIMTLAGFDAKGIDGAVGSGTRAAYDAIAEKYGLEETKSGHKMHDQLLVLYASNPEFKKTVQDNAIKAVEANSDRNAVKAAQVFMNFELDGKDLVIDGRSPPTLKSGGVSKTYESMGRLKEKMGAEASIEKEVIKAQDAEKKAVMTLVEDKAKLEKELKQETQHITIAKDFSKVNKADLKIEGNDKRGVKTLEAAFNQVAPGLFNEKDFNSFRQTRKMFKDSGDFHKSSTRFIAQEGDVAFLKGREAVRISKVEDGKVYQQDEKGNDVEIPAEDIKGFGDTSELIEHRQNFSPLSPTG